jgi:chorismate--pyruvate lyase
MYNRGTEPRWHPVDGALRRRVPTDLRDWLIGTASLTARLRALYGRGFHVRVRSQRWLRPAFSERAALGMADHRVAIVREVHLWCVNEPVVFARTIIPAEALEGPGRRLAHLGARPLGALLFADHRIVRKNLELARIDPSHAVHASATGGRDGESLWGRRSVFLVRGQPILVSEIFLPAILREEGRK